MVEANVKIIEELKSFLETVSGDAAIRKLFTEHETDFTRDRKLPLQRIAGLIINLPKRSLSIEIEAFFDSLTAGLEGCTKGAFCLQRSKLKPLFFQVWNQWLADSFYHHYSSHVKRWRGFIVQAVDGSSAYLFNKEDVIAHFGTYHNQYVSTPMARVMQLHDVLNDLTRWGNLYPVKDGEQAILAKQIPRLSVDSLTLLDRGFASYGLMYLMVSEETPRHFVMRCSTVFNKEVGDFARSSKKSKVVELRPSHKAIAMLRQNGYIVTAATVLKIRMVQVNLPGGGKEILLTNLYDEKLYTTCDLKYLYGLRWGIETAYNKQKNQQQMEQFSGHRVVCIEQDYAAGLFVANLQSLIEKQCDPYLQKVAVRRKHRYRINRNVSWAWLKHSVVKLFLQNEPAEILVAVQKAFERNLEPVRPGRNYKRTTKAKRQTGKYQTSTNYKRAI